MAVAAEPAPFSSGRHQISPIGSTLRKASYMAASIEPGPPNCLARATLDTSTSWPRSGLTTASLTCATISRRMADDALLAAELSISA
ncbi:hypothetical protein D3C81_2062370 [compost metagenome]